MKDMISKLGKIVTVMIVAVFAVVAIIVWRNPGISCFMDSIYYLLGGTFAAIVLLVLLFYVLYWVNLSVEFRMYKKKNEQEAEVNWRVRWCCCKKCKCVKTTKP